MYHVDMSESGHDFDKQNLVTVHDRKKGGYDLYKCKNCGIIGKSRTIGIIQIPESYNEISAYKCKKQIEFTVPKRIKITKCLAHGKQFANVVIPGSEHDVVSPPDMYVNDRTGVWVMGIGEKVKILRGEYEPI
ncbi:MAG: hypothetical protein FD170_3998 [Bacteroidetes bacterium]|nr:MAG: hypothetical protein FD170_3998 [Bacteroidota bacterium]